MSQKIDPNAGESAGLNVGALAGFSKLNLLELHVSDAPQILFLTSEGVVNKSITLIKSPQFEPNLSVSPFVKSLDVFVLTPQELINGTVLSRNVAAAFAAPDPITFTLPRVDLLINQLDLKKTPKAPTYADGVNRSYVRGCFSLTIIRSNDVILRAPIASPLPGHAGLSGYARISIETGAITDLAAGADVTVKNNDLADPNQTRGTQQEVFFIVLQNADNQVPTIAFFA